MVSECRHCGGADIEYDVSRGDSTCTSCGAVLDESVIVSSLSFTQDGSSASTMVGQFVPTSGPTPLGTGAKASGSGTSLAYGKESRDVTIARGRFKISQVAMALHMTSHHVDAAHRLFMLAVQHNFIQGRKTEYVVAACLYIVCRREKTQHMLIDFSDVLQTNVYVLGKTFMKFVRLISINLPIIDPSLYVHRFASKLEFEEKTHSVAMTALRLVARMKRDWIQTGRRPAGICGASLIIAARLHGFRRSQREVGRVVKICEATLRKRLMEFIETPTSNLTFVQFRETDLATSSDPPSFKKGLAVGEAMSVKKKGGCGDDGERADEDEAEMASGKRLADEGEDVEPDAEEMREIQEEMNRVLQSDEMKNLQKDMLKAVESAGGAKSSSITGGETQASACGDGRLTPDATKAPTLDAVGDEEAACNEPEPAEEELLSDSDDEVENMILSDKEMLAKERIWTVLNKEYLEEQEEKRKFEAEQIALGIVPDSQKRKRRRQAKPAAMQAKTPAEATMNALANKKVSSKINYDALKELLSQSSVHAQPAEDDADGTVAKITAEESTASDAGQDTIEPGEDAEDVDEMEEDLAGDDDGGHDLRAEMGYHEEVDHIDYEYD